MAFHWLSCDKLSLAGLLLNKRNCCFLLLGSKTVADIGICAVEWYVPESAPFWQPGSSFMELQVQEEPSQGQGEASELARGDPSAPGRPGGGPGDTSRKGQRSVREEEGTCCRPEMGSEQGRSWATKQPASGRPGKGF